MAAYLFYLICLIVGLNSCRNLVMSHAHLELVELWKAVSLSALIIGSYFWMRRDLWSDKETRHKDKGRADQWGGSVVAFIWLIIIAPLATVKADPININRDLFLSILFIALPVSNGIARLLEKQRFF